MEVRWPLRHNHYKWCKDTKCISGIEFFKENYSNTVTEAVKVCVTPVSSSSAAKPSTCTTTSSTPESASRSVSSFLTTSLSHPLITFSHFLQLVRHFLKPDYRNKNGNQVWLFEDWNETTPLRNGSALTCWASTIMSMSFLAILQSPLVNSDIDVPVRLKVI